MLTIWALSAICNVLILIGLCGWAQYLSGKSLEKKQAFITPEAWCIAVLSLLFGTQLLGLVHTALAGAVALTVLLFGLTKVSIPQIILDRRKPTVSVVVALPVLYFILKLFDAAVPLPHGDPLTYHLRGPLFWVEQRRIVFPAEIPVAAICNLVEMLFLLVLEWMKHIPFVDPTSTGQAALRGRLIGQISGQWLSISIGFATTLFVLGQLWRKLELNFNLKKAAPGLFVLLIWIITMAPQTEWLVPLAKNNWLATAFVLFPLVLFSTPLLMGASFAAAYWAKATNLLVLLPIAFGLALFFFSEKKPHKKALHFFIGAVTLSLPFLVRNYLWTGNPFYPSELGPFKSILISQSDRLDISRFFAPFHVPPPPYYWEALVNLVAPFLIEKKIRFVTGAIPYLAGIAALVGFTFLGCTQKRSRKGALIVSTTTIVCIFWIGVVIGPRFFEPHILPVLLLLRFAGVFGIYWVLNRTLKTQSQLVVQSIFWIFIGATSVNLPVHVLWKDFWPLASGRVSFSDSVYNMPYGSIYRCIEEKIHHATPNSYPRIASDWLNTTYYITGPQIPNSGNVAPLEAELHSIASLKERLEYLKNRGFKYVWMSHGCDSKNGAVWPTCSVLGDYAIRDFEPNDIVCQEGGTFILRL